MKKPKPNSSIGPDPGRSPEAVIGLHEIYNRVSEMSFEEAVSELRCIKDLIHHNPHFRIEVMALRRITTGELLLNHLRGEANHL